jgi:hypothetical protein
VPAGHKPSLHKRKLHVPLPSAVDPPYDAGPVLLGVQGATARALEVALGVRLVIRGRGAPVDPRVCTKAEKVRHTCSLPCYECHTE